VPTHQQDARQSSGVELASVAADMLELLKFGSKGPKNCLIVWSNSSAHRTR